jgi:hypothetical protein
MTRYVLVGLMSVMVLSCGPGIAQVGDPPPGSAAPTALQPAAVELSAATVVSGDSLTATVSYLNTGAAPAPIEALTIELLPPGSAPELGPVEALSPVQGPTTVQPGASLSLTAVKGFSAQDPQGTWEAYAVVRKVDGTRVRGRGTRFYHSSDGGAAPLPDGGPLAPPDAGGVPPVHDAGVPPVPDAGLPPVHDAGIPPVPDAGPVPPPPPPPGGLVEAVSPGAGDVTFTIRADSDVHPISPLIYGVNQVTNLATTQRGVGLVRAGGNRWTAFNWENSASNAGIDYNNQNDNYLVTNQANGGVPGEAVRSRTDVALASGAAMLVTIPIQGYVAADKLGTGDVNQTAGYLQTRFKQTVARKNAPFSLTPDTTDGYVYQDEFASWLKTQYPSAFAAVSPRILISLDNEPDLWSDSHPRIQPTPVSAATLVAKNIEFASAVKAVIPTATVTGLVSYGYYGFASWGGLYAGDFTAYYLDQMRLAEATAQKRLIDVLDLHWYPEATGDGQRITGESVSAGSVAARVQAPRSLWDPTYRETSWVANAEGGPIALIPRMQARIAAHYPGTRLGFTEYSYGGGSDISGAIAEADTLGIFGREGVYLANFWSLASGADMIHAGIRAYTSFDEAGAHFGDTSVRAVTSNVASTSVYASIDAARTGRMVIVAINKTGVPINAALTLAAYGTYTSATVRRITAGSSTLQAAGSIAATTRNGFLYQLPAYSVSILLPQ